MADNREEARSRQSQQGSGDPRQQNQTGTTGHGAQDSSRMRSNEGQREERGAHNMQNTGDSQRQTTQHQQNPGQSQHSGNMERESVPTGRKESEGTRGEQEHNRQDEQRRKSA